MSQIFLTKFFEFWPWDACEINPNVPSCDFREDYVLRVESSFSGFRFRHLWNKFRSKSRNRNLLRHPISGPSADLREGVRLQSAHLSRSVQHDDRFSTWKARPFLDNDVFTILLNSFCEQMYNIIFLSKNFFLDFHFPGPAHWELLTRGRAVDNQVCVTFIRLLSCKLGANDHFRLRATLGLYLSPAGQIHVKCANSKLTM